MRDFPNVVHVGQGQWQYTSPGYQGIIEPTWECRVFWGSDLVVIRGCDTYRPSWFRRAVMRLVFGTVWKRIGGEE
jgi:hypothetical protein